MSGILVQCLKKSLLLWMKSELHFVMSKIIAFQRDTFKI